MAALAAYLGVLRTLGHSLVETAVTTRWVFAMCLLAGGCSTRSYFPAAPSFPQGEALTLVERGLTAEMAKPSVVPRADPDYLYVRIGERAAPVRLLRRVPVQRP